MIERLLNGDVAQLLGRLAKKRTARSGEYDSFQNLFIGHALQTLENRRVLAVYGKQPDAVFPHRVGDQIAACHKGFFVGKGDVLLCLRRSYSRLKPHHAYHGIENQIRLRQLRSFNQTLHAAEHLGRSVGDGNLQLLCLLPVENHSKCGFVLAHLLFE